MNETIKKLIIKALPFIGQWIIKKLTPVPPPDVNSK